MEDFSSDAYGKGGYRLRNRCGKINGRVCFMEKLSVVIATKNEEKSIRRCLESVKWADEIIIVDDMSNDKTIEIAKQYTSRIIINDSKGRFHKNKNIGIENAAYEWVLSLDADEVITPELALEIKNAIKNSNKLGYYINRKNYFLNKWVRGCGWYPDYIIRLFRKGTTYWPIEIHDTPKIEPKDKVGKLKSSLIHYSYSSFGQYFEKFNYYTTILSQEEKEKSVRINRRNFILYFFIKPLYWFTRKYLLLEGYKDGFIGFFISLSSALTIFITYAKLWEWQREL